VEVRSLGYRTDLALLRLGGSEIEDRGDHVVVRSPHNPTFWWGNFLLLPSAPQVSDTERWLERFVETFPDCQHMAFGFDGTDGAVGDLAGFAQQGLRCEASTVLQASSVHEPARSNREATYRRLVSDDDWAQSVDLRVTCRDPEDEDADVHRVFATRKVATNRELTEAGHGAWFGAFVDGRLLCHMGLFAASPGLARYQSVETHPAARGRGLAGTLVYEVARYGFAELAAHTLVMVADPDYPAVRLYRSVGFVDRETQLQAERPPGQA
jgi:ribosomal protein S18 acetylase RimI-like enzyme